MMKQVILLVLFFSYSICFGAWSTIPTVNNPICIAADYQQRTVICSDGAGGAIIAWQDFRSGTSWDIYAQRIDANGNTKWTSDGIPICNQADQQMTPQIAEDGAGGAYISWLDDRNYTVYAQRVSSSGTAMWTANGVQVYLGTGLASDHKLITDLSGNAILAWVDNRNGWDGDIFAQKLSNAGSRMWTASGVQVCVYGSYVGNMQMIADGGNGAIIVWDEYLIGGYNNRDIYAQKINSSGIYQWTLHGKAICTAANSQTYPKLVPDGSGGAIIVWNDERSGGDYDVYAQKVDASGTLSWTPGEVAVCALGSWQLDPAIISTSSNGAIIAWRDLRSGMDEGVYIQELNHLGAPLWAVNGVLACTTPGSQFYPNLINDGNDNAILSWNYDNSQNPPNGYTEIFVQLYNSSGVPQWQTNGVPVNTGTNQQEFCGVAVADNVGGAIIAWKDMRNGYVDDIYAQRVFGNGTLYGAAQNEVIINEFDADVTDEWVELLVVKPGGIDLCNWIITDEDPVNMSSPTEGKLVFADNSLLRNIATATYVVVINGSGTDSFDYVNKEITLYRGNSNVNVSGTFDLNNAGDNLTLWYDDNGTWDSVQSIGIDHISYKISVNPPSGVTWSGPIAGTRDSSGNEAYFSNGSSYNNDNSSSWTPTQTHTPGETNPGQNDPPLPVTLSHFSAVELSGASVQLNWTTQSETNNNGWNIYRGETENALINDESQILNSGLISGAGSSSNPTNYSFADTYPVFAEQEYWYWLESIDFSGSSEIYGPVSIIILQENDEPETPEIPFAYGLYQNFPNPFNPETTICFTAEESGKTTIEIYNPKGRKVRTLFNGQLTEDDVLTLIWNGKDDAGKDVTSGIYMYKAKSRRKTHSKKMILIK
jgi:hypothetical protein